MNSSELELVTFGTGQKLFNAGSLASSLYFIEDGRVLLHGPKLRPEKEVY